MNFISKKCLDVLYPSKRKETKFMSLTRLELLFFGPLFIAVAVAAKAGQ